VESLENLQAGILAPLRDHCLSLKTRNKLDNHLIQGKGEMEPPKIFRPAYLTPFEIIASP